MPINLKNSDNWFDFDKSDVQEYESLANQVQMYKIRMQMSEGE